MSPKRQNCDRQIDFRRLSAFLQLAGEPDFAFLDELVDGIRLGVDAALPRVAKVFEQKKKGLCHSSRKGSKV